MKFLMKIKYDGSSFHGWQVQPNDITVQQTVQDALEKVLSVRPDVTGCSRTDSGVHAKEYCFHFEMDTKMSGQNLVSAINTKLPSEISAFDCYTVDNDFHARYSVKTKRYEYVFYDGKTRDPFYSKYSWFVGRKLDEKLLDKAAKQFVGTYDFSGFCASGSSVADTTRTVVEASVTREGDRVIFSVEADGFLYNMVRIMAGTLYYVSLNKISPEQIKSIILSKDRTKAGVTAPAHALFLANVNY